MHRSATHNERQRVCRLLTPAICLLAALVGCGPSRPKTVQVTGTVTLDGTAVEGATVMFMPEGGGRPATGITDKDGKFTLKTFEAGDGALVGKHLVSITKKEVSGFMADESGLSGGVAPGGVQEKWIVPPKYADPKTSDLTCDVQPRMEPPVYNLSSK